ncbi:MAG: response regulator, partial [Candidatus Eisenbacteria bacterium]|nr:response regulator [Candidatus Eisenbacteria bacterium]
MHAPLPKILIVEDEPALGRLLATWLRQDGYDIVSTKTAEEARALYWAERPAVVLTEIVLPGRSGMTLLRSLRRRHPDIPVILLTARHDVHLAAKAIRWEAFDYLIKPVARAELSVTLDRACRLLQIRSDMRRYTQALEQRVQQDLEDLDVLHGRLRALEGEVRQISRELAELPPARETAARLDACGGVLRRTLESWPARPQELRAVWRAVHEDVLPKSPSPPVPIVGALPDELAHVAVNGPLLTHTLAILIRRAREEAHLRRAPEVRFRAAERGGRLIFSLEFDSVRSPQEEESRTMWAPSPWVRRRVLW